MNAPTSIHPSEQILRSYGLGKLDDGTAEAVSQHLKQCPDCRKRVAEMPADSFLDRIRDAQGRPAAPSPLVSSLAGLSMMSAGPDSLSPPRAGTLPPGLADHPDYKILRELGQGGMGVVYLAENTMMGRKEVLKVVSSHLLEPPRRARTLPRRDPPRGRAAPPQCGHGLLGPSPRREPRPGDGVRRGIGPGPAGQNARPAAGGQRLQLPAPGGPGSPARSRKRHGPSRHQARQPHARRAGQPGAWSRCSTSGWPR